uniref:Uncharacterized protein n=1 Tax=Arundo donax TaxID=35708 RepID=A0A0A9BED7_ARUDO
MQVNFLFLQKNKTFKSDKAFMNNGISFHVQKHIKWTSCPP